MDIQKEYTGLLEAFNSVYTSQEVEQLDEGMTMKDFKQQRSRQKQKDKREALKTSPTRRAGIHADKASPERAARHRANVDPDFEGNDERNYPGGKLRPNKVRKAKALGELDEATYSAKAARAGEDIGKPGKAFAKIAKEAGKRYGSEERGKKVAGAVLAKLRAEETDLFDYILEHLVAEGYADTNEAALAIMANMSEEWREDIVEGMTMDDFKKQRRRIKEEPPIRKRGGISAPEDERTIGGQANRDNKDYWASVIGKNRDRGAGNKAKRRAAELG